MEKETSHFFEPEISLEKDSYIETLKHNIEKYMGFANITIKDLSEAANIPFSTLNNLLYSKTYKDCKLSTVINLARAMEIPEDISVTGYDGINILSQYEPRLTTVRQNTVKIGQVAAEKLMECIENPGQAGTETVVVETELEKGRTVGRVYY